MHVAVLLSFDLVEKLKKSGGNQGWSKVLGKEMVVVQSLIEAKSTMQGMMMAVEVVELQKKFDYA